MDRMPISTEKYVESMCDLSLRGLLPPLAYNVILVVVCLIWAFKARALPDNFNESRYIFLSVCCTLFVWIAFLPTYFSAFYATQKTLLLVVALLLNSFIVLLCLYCPKVYALFYVDEENMHIKMGTSSVLTTPHT